MGGCLYVFDCVFYDRISNIKTNQSMAISYGGSLLFIFLNVSIIENIYV